MIFGIIIGILLLFMVLASNGLLYGLFHNYLSLEGARASLGYHIGGDVLFAIALWLWWKAYQDDYKWQISNVLVAVIGAVIFAIGVCANCGFNFDLSSLPNIP